MQKRILLKTQGSWFSLDRSETSDLNCAETLLSEKKTHQCLCHHGCDDQCLTRLVPQWQVKEPQGR